MNLLKISKNYENTQKENKLQSFSSQQNAELQKFENAKFCQ